MNGTLSIMMIAILLWAASAPLACAAALPTAAGAAPNSPLFMLMPELAHAAAPTWVKAGLRMDYEGTIGSITELNVVGVDADLVAVQTTPFVSLDPGEAPRIAGGALGMLFSPGAGGEHWVNPTVLKKLTNRTSGPTKIYRMNFTAIGKPRPSVWIQTITESGQTEYIFEAATGALLRYSAFGPQRDPGNPGPGPVLFYQTLVGMRQVEFPWSKQFSLPDAAGYSNLQFTGTTSRVFPGLAGTTHAYSIRYAVKRHGVNWAAVNMSTSEEFVPGMAPMTQNTPLVIGPGSYGGLWIPPAVLAGLRAGQVLDKDPFSQLVTSVTGPQTTPSGVNIVVLSVENAAVRMDYGYEVKTGLLTAIRIREHLKPPITDILVQRTL